MVLVGALNEEGEGWVTFIEVGGVGETLEEGGGKVTGIRGVNGGKNRRLRVSGEG